VKKAKREEHTPRKKRGIHVAQKWSQNLMDVSRIHENVIGRRVRGEGERE